MTSMPASRRARAMIFAPRSWPSRPGLATTTRILRAMPDRLTLESRPRLREAARVHPRAHPHAADLLRTEHAAVRVLASAENEAEAYPALLAAIGSELGCNGALWLPFEDGELHCAHAWPADAAAAADLVALVWETGQPAARRSAFAFPIPAVGVMAFATAAPLEPDTNLLATMDSLGAQISQFVERLRAQQAVKASDARKSAILNAAFDCIITMDHEGNILEVNKAAERTFGYTGAEMVGREVAALIIPPSLREQHRAGVARFLRTGRSQVRGKRLLAIGMRKDGREFPLEIIITQPNVPGPPLFCGYLRDVSEQRERESELRRLAAEQAALRRVATAGAGARAARAAFAVVTEEVASLLLAQSATLVRFDGHSATAVGAWNEQGARGVPVGTTMPIDGDTVAARVYRTGAPARVESYGALHGGL